VRPSPGFLLRFFGLAAVLFALWNFGGFGDGYGRAVMSVSSPLMWLTSGFHVAAAQSTPDGLDVTLARGSEETPLPMRPREQFSGLIPFLALVGASSAAWRRRLRALALGVAILFVFHVGLGVIGPYMTGLPQSSLSLVWVRRVNKLIDIFYGFYGLVGYAALPFLLWFWLLRTQAALTEPAPAPAPAAAPETKRGKRKARRRS
jgi:hypothetical protein